MRSYNNVNVEIDGESRLADVDEYEIWDDLSPIGYVLKVKFNEKIQMFKGLKEVTVFQTLIVEFYCVNYNTIIEAGYHKNPMIELNK